MNRNILKVLRFAKLYGFQRTIIKVAGRTRNRKLNVFFPKVFLGNRKADISLIGCGQFGFSTISYFVLKQQGNRFFECYDVNEKQMNSNAKFWHYIPQKDIHRLLSNPAVKIIYIASNHYTHTEYATIALKEKKIVYVEKPISVNFEQFAHLLHTKQETNGELYVGYNRPFSKAVSQLKQYLPKKKPFSITYFIVGHKLEADHWYRDPKEGTRVCGNMGHWIDLTVHLMAARDFIPDEFRINIVYTNEQERDDNVNVTLSTDFGDIVSIVLTARAEPFEGINETINIQSGEFIAKINDFRKMQIWKDAFTQKFSYHPKDVGHKKAINQPFDNEKRNFYEIEISTVIMLVITEMVQLAETHKTIRPEEILNGLKKLPQD